MINQMMPTCPECKNQYNMYCERCPRCYPGGNVRKERPNIDKALMKIVKLLREDLCDLQIMQFKMTSQGLEQLREFANCNVIETWSKERKTHYIIEAKNATYIIKNNDYVIRSSDDRIYVQRYSEYT